MATIRINDIVTSDGNNYGKVHAISCDGLALVEHATGRREWIDCSDIWTLAQEDMSADPSQALSDICLESFHARVDRWLCAAMGS